MVSRRVRDHGEMGLIRVGCVYTEYGRKPNVQPWVMQQHAELFPADQTITCHPQSEVYDVYGICHWVTTLWVICMSDHECECILLGIVETPAGERKIAEASRNFTTFHQTFILILYISVYLDVRQGMQRWSTGGSTCRLNVPPCLQNRLKHLRSWRTASTSVHTLLLAAASGSSYTWKTMSSISSLSQISRNWKITSCACDASCAHCH